MKRDHTKLPALAKKHLKVVEVAPGGAHHNAAERIGHEEATIIVGLSGSKRHTRARRETLVFSMRRPQEHGVRRKLAFHHANAQSPAPPPIKATAIAVATRHAIRISPIFMTISGFSIVFVTVASSIASAAAVIGNWPWLTIEAHDRLIASTSTRPVSAASTYKPEFPIE
ncbi:MAG: hypothetical protein WAN81_12255 [Candidatus Binataceae bacterium]